MLNFLLKTIQKAIKPYLHAWQRNGKHVLVLPLQASCTVATSHLYRHYNVLVAGLQAACSAPPCQKAHCKGLPLMWPKLVYVRIMDSKQ